MQGFAGLQIEWFGIPKQLEILISMRNGKMRKEIIESIKSWKIWLLVGVLFVGFVLLRPESPVLATVNAPVNSNLGAGIAHPGFADLVDAVAPAVVSIYGQRAVTEANSDMRQYFFEQFPDFQKRWGQRNWPFFGDPDNEQFRDFDFRGPDRNKRWRQQTQGGSGVIIDTDGYIITNYHVIADADNIRVKMSDGRELSAELVGTDQFADLAVLKIEGDGGFPYAEFGDSDESRVGDWVVAIGDPFGLSGSVTLGVLSAKSRSLSSGSPQVPLFQIDAAINKGNSGGPLFNTQGQVIGLNTLIFSPTGNNVGVGFAVPSAELEKVSYSLMSQGRVSRGQLGIMIQNITEDMADALDLDSESQGRWGALVADVTADSAADQAGIRSGDVVVEYDGKSVDSVQSLPPLVRQTQPGDQVSIVVIRDGEPLTLTATIGEMSYEQTASLTQQDSNDTSRQSSPSVGLALAELDSDLRRQFNIKDDVEGVIVLEVRPDSPAEAAGLQPGDIIRSIDRNSVNSTAHFRDHIESLSESDSEQALVHVERNGSKRFTVIDLS